jgi:hypothetical protein
MAAEQASSKNREQQKQAKLATGSTDRDLFSSLNAQNFPDACFTSAEVEQASILQRLAGLDSLGNDLEEDVDAITGSRMSTDQSGCTRLFLQSNGAKEEVPVEMVQMPPTAKETVAKVAQVGGNKNIVKKKKHGNAKGHDQNGKKNGKKHGKGSLTHPRGVGLGRQQSNSNTRTTNSGSPSATATRPLNPISPGQQAAIAIAKVEQAAHSHYRSTLFKDRLRETIVVDAVLHPEGLGMVSLWAKLRNEGYEYDPHGFKREVKAAIHAGHTDYLALRNDLCKRLGRAMMEEEKISLTQILSMANANNCLYNNYPSPYLPPDEKKGKAASTGRGASLGLSGFFTMPVLGQKRRRNSRSPNSSTDSNAASFNDVQVQSRGGSNDISNGSSMDSPEKKKSVNIRLDRNVTFINPRKPRFAGWKSHY